MPWYYKEADSISRSEVEDIARRVLDEAKKRLGCEFRRVLLLPVR